MANATASDGIGGGLPPQDAGNSGFVLTTTTTGNLSNASWESAATASLPSQVGQNGNYLTTNGTVASWAAVGGGGVTTVGAFGSTPNANAMSISGVTLTGQPADATHPGFVTTAAQTMAGVKTFSSNPVASGLTGSAAATGGVGTTFNNTTTQTTGKITSFQTGGAEQAFIDFAGCMAGSQTNGLPWSLGGFGGLAALWLQINHASRSGVNYNMFSDASSTVINGPSVGISFRIANSVIAGFNSVGLLDMTGGGQTLKLSTTDLSGTPGAGTANTATGFAALVATSGAAFKITNSLVTATSRFFVCYATTPDSTAGALGAAYTSGGFNISSAGTAAGNTKIQWWVVN
jgi:hypothetical protein